MVEDEALADAGHPPDDSPQHPPSPTPSGWPSWAYPEPADSLARPAERDYFLAQLTAIDGELVEGKCGISVDTEIHDRILDRLLERARNGSEARRFARWWDRLVDAGNRDGRWKIAIPTTIQPLPPIRAPIVRRDFQLLHALRPIQSGLIEGIRRNESQRTGAGLAAATYLSAVLFGGLVTTARLTALRAAWGKVSANWNGTLGVELAVAGPREEIRDTVWYPDALTSSLLARLLEAPTSASVPVPPPESLKEALRILDLPAWPHGERDFLRAAETALLLEIPGFVVSVLADKRPSQSLAPRQLTRLSGFLDFDVEGPANASDRSQPLAEAGPRQEGDPFLVDNRYVPGEAKVSQARILRQVTSILMARREIQARLEQLIDDNASGLWPITLLLIRWVKWLLNPSGDRRRVVESTALTYFLILAKRLVWIASDDDVLDYEPEDFEALYEAAAADIRSEAQQGRYWGRALLFHEFLFFCGAPDVTLQELDGYVSSGKSRVSANLICEREFSLFKSTVLAEYASTRDESLARVYLAGLLGYRLGLRRREAQMVRLYDIHPGSQPILIVRPSRLASLKTQAARRQLPLRVLLSPEELDFFETYVARRRAQIGEGNGLLFAFPGAPDTPIAASELFDPVSAIFSAICNDSVERFRYQHLRHSFANWLLIALVASDEPSLVDARPPFIDSWMLSPEQMARIREGLFPRLAGTDPQPSRRHLYQVAALMGHLSPATTLRCYLHLVDWLAGRELDQALDRHLGGWQASDLGGACGISRTISSRSAYSALAPTPSKFLRRFVSIRMARVLPKHVKRTDNHVDLRGILQQSLRGRTFGVLTSMTVLQRLGRGTSIEFLERAFCIPGQAIRSADAAYTQIYAKQSDRHAKRSFKLPYEPRCVADRVEFWRIARAAELAYAKESNRDPMIAAAEALIRRTGPRVGHIRFGDDPRSAPVIVDGLLHMGLSLQDLTLVIRHPAHGPSTDTPTQSAIAAIAKMGIRCREDALGWAVRREVRTLLQLDLDISRKTGPYRGLRWGLRVAALNYVAVWIRMASVAGRFHSGGESLDTAFAHEAIPNHNRST